MKKLVASAFALALFASPALSQSMRESHQGYQSVRLFIGAENTMLGGNFIYGVFGNGNVHLCPWKLSSPEACKNGTKRGVINGRFRDDPYLREYYIENGNLVEYSCWEGSYMNCMDSPTKEVFRPR